MFLSRNLYSGRRLCFCIRNDTSSLAPSKYIGANDVLLQWSRGDHPKASKRGRHQANSSGARLGTLWYSHCTIRRFIGSWFRSDSNGQQIDQNMSSGLAKGERPQPLSSDKTQLFLFYYIMSILDTSDFIVDRLLKCFVRRVMCLSLITLLW